MVLFGDQTVSSCMAVRASLIGSDGAFCTDKDSEARSDLYEPEDRVITFLLLWSCVCVDDIGLQRERKRKKRTFTERKARSYRHTYMF